MKNKIFCHFRDIDFFQIFVNFFEVQKFQEFDLFLGDWENAIEQFSLFLFSLK